MATWIVHLRIAELLLGQIAGLDAPLFAVGNIAPDSGIPDEKWEKFTPDPAVTHFKVETDTYYGCADLEFFRRHLLPLRDGESDPLGYSFLLGYFCHLLTDNLWWQIIDKPNRERYGEQFAIDRNFIWEIKQDWYGLDQRYVREHPGSLFWRVFLNCAYDRADLDFLPKEATQQRIAYIQKFYQDDGEPIHQMMARPFIYLSQAQMDAFVEEAAATIAKVQRRVWQADEALEGKVSGLELVEG